MSVYQLDAVSFTMCRGKLGLIRGLKEIMWLLVFLPI